MINLLSKWVSIKELWGTSKEETATPKPKQLKIEIAKDFSMMPAGIDDRDTPDNGKKFREEYLRPTLNKARENGMVVVVDFDGTDGYGSAFLREAFGGLISKDHYCKEDLDNILELKATSFYVTYRDIAEKFMEEADEKPANNNQPLLL